MHDSFDIHPVPPDRLAEAMRFLAAGSRRSAAAAKVAGQFAALAKQAQGHSTAVWALRRNRPVAVAMTVDRPGRSAVVYYNVSVAPGVTPSASAAVTAYASQQAIDRGIAFVQAVTTDLDGPDATMLYEAGFERLADLETLRLDLPAAGGEALPCESGRTFRPLSQLAEGELEAVVLATHEQSLDCPKLAGLRSPAEILAGHKASHRFTPETWWIVDVDTRPAGACLVSDTTSDASAMVVYLGVIPPMRGRSIARAMLRHAARVSFGRGRSSLQLAVDLRNTYARNAYLLEGFQPIRASHILIRRAESPPRKG